jgi:hypothetical protein
MANFRIPAGALRDDILLGAVNGGDDVAKALARLLSAA